MANIIKANEQHVKAKAWTTYYGKSANDLICLRVGFNDLSLRKSSLKQLVQAKA